jgi:hypothetical protein
MSRLSSSSCTGRRRLYNGDGAVCIHQQQQQRKQLYHRT